VGNNFLKTPLVNTLCYTLLLQCALVLLVKIIIIRISKNTNINTNTDTNTTFMPSNYERANHDMDMARAMRGNKKREPVTVSSKNVQAALTRLDRAESLAQQGILEEALSVYEDAIGETIGIVNELKKSQPDDDDDDDRDTQNSNKTSLDVLMSRVRVALSDAESLKENIKRGKKESAAEENDKLPLNRKPLEKSPEKDARRSNFVKSFSARFFSNTAQMYDKQQASSSVVDQKKSNANIPSRTIHSSKSHRSIQQSKNNLSTQPSKTNKTYDKQQASYNVAQKKSNGNVPSRTIQPSKSHRSIQQSKANLSTHPSKTAKTYGDKRQASSNVLQKKSNLNYQSDDPFIATIKADMYVDSSTLTTRWDDISGLTTAKRSLQEAAILPLLRPDLYTGLRSPPKGILLYGPPGTGKTMLVKAVAHESQCILFACSASAMTSKWVGEGEKLVRTLFRFALDVAPSIVFLDEMDSLLGRRKSNGDSEGEGSRRFKTEFMVQMEGITAGSGSEGGVEKRMLVIGCTNCPWDIDDAVMRRFQRRIYVPLPDKESRLALWENISNKANEGENPKRGDNSSASLTAQEIKQLVKISHGFSCSDIASIANEAAFGPLRDIGGIDVIRNVKTADVRPILARDFIEAIKNSKKSVSNESLKHYEEWEDAQAAGGS